MKDHNQLQGNLPLMKKRMLVIAAFAFIVCAGCNNQDEKERAPEMPQTVQEDGETGIIQLSAAQMRVTGIETGAIGQKNLTSVVKASGRLAVPPQNHANVATLMGGVIKNIFVLEGNYVKKGQTLATIENPEFIRLQQEYLTTGSELLYVEQEYQRQKALNEQGAGTGKLFQQASARYNAQKATLKALEEQLRQIHINTAGLSADNITGEIPVTAPISGTVGHINISIGSYVDAAKPLMEIVDNARIHCDLLVYEKDLPRVKRGQKVNFILTNRNDEPISGEIYGINSSFEDESKAVIVHAVIEDASKYKLIPGMYVSARIDAGHQSVAAVPTGAIVRFEGKEYIFAVTGTPSSGDSIYGFKKAAVITGVTDQGYTAITPLEDLPPHTEIVTKGAFYILSEAAGGSEEEE